MMLAHLSSTNRSGGGPPCTVIALTAAVSSGTIRSRTFSLDSR